MQFIDLGAQQDRIGSDIEARIRGVLAHGGYVMGPEVAELESRLAEYAGMAYCMGVSSGTDALLIALMALGVGPGDEVITTPFSFVATAETVALLGASPVFVDIDARTYNLDPSHIEAAITAQTRAILPVGLFGQMPDMAAINDIAGRHDLPVIEDAAQCFGASVGGRRACSVSTIGVTSFFPAKPLGCYGDGGAVFTDDPDLARRIGELRNHGQDRAYHYSRVGLNARLDTIQAAILLSKLSIFDDEIDRRNQVAARYDEQLGEHLQTPLIARDHRSVYAQYTIEVDDRDRVREALAAADIPTAVYYPVPLNRQPPFPNTTHTPIATAAAQRVVSLPMHPYLTPELQDSVCRSLRQAISQCAA